MRGLLTIIVLLAVLGCPRTGVAADPNVAPGRWKITSTTRVIDSGDDSTQVRTETRCIAEGDIRDGSVFLGSLDRSACEVDEQDLERDGMKWRLVCTDESADRQVEVDLEASFAGTYLEGSSTVRMRSGGTTTRMRTRMEGRRAGDC